jgi:hypothetical protein
MHMIDLHQLKRQIFILISIIVKLKKQLKVTSDEWGGRCHGAFRMGDGRNRWPTLVLAKRRKLKKHSKTRLIKPCTQASIVLSKNRYPIRIYTNALSHALA